jgi:cell wall-associated NlpC family hydrolase
MHALHKPFSHRSRDLQDDSGTIQLWLTAGSGAALVLASVLLGAGAAITGSAAACQPQSGISDQAETSIPTDYLDLYRATGEKTGIPWNVLAAVGKVESDHGRDPNPDSGVCSGANWAGAAGPMQIGIGGKATNNWGGPPRHRANRHTDGYATDGNGDGWANVYDPADAIPAAASMLKSHGAPGDIRRALFAYNGATAYVDKVLAWADRYAGAPPSQADASDPACQQALGSAAIPSKVARRVITYARKQLGKPYVWGAEGPDAYDCSGLAMMAYRSAGVAIPRTTFEQWRHGTRIPKGQQQPGDLVFFNSGPGSSPGNPGHVGIVLTHQKMINARCPTCHPGIAIQDYTKRDNLEGFVRPAVARHSS